MFWRKWSPDTSDVGVDGALERVDPDRAEADVPVQLVGAGADGGVVREPEIAGERRGAEAGPRVQPLPSRIGSATRLFDTVLSRAAVDRDAVGKRRRLHRVVVEDVVRVVAAVERPTTSPSVVARVAEEVVRHRRVGHTACGS